MSVKKRKKALIFIEDGSFTYDNRVIREADALVNDGWYITVISPKYAEDPFYKKINDRLVTYFYPKPTAVSTIGHFFEHSITLILGNLLVFWVFFRHGFSIFHACNPMDILWLIALPYKLFGKKFIYDQHDLCPEIYLCRKSANIGTLFYKILLSLEKSSYKSADAIISTNESYKEIAVNRGGVNPEDIFVVRNGPDLKQFKKVFFSSNILKGEGEILVGYIGNMGPHDGVSYLLKTASVIIRRHKRTDIKFVLIGRGSDQPGLIKESEKMDLKEYVNFTGRIPDDKVLEVLSACDICVQPDPLNPLNDKSTMNKAMEYMALGKPVVAFDLKETKVSCGDAALYVRPNDVTEFAEMIIYLTDKPEIRYRMGEIGRERIRNNLAWDYSVSNLLAAYNYVE